MCPSAGLFGEFFKWPWASVLGSRGSDANTATFLPSQRLQPGGQTRKVAADRGACTPEAHRQGARRAWQRGGHGCGRGGLDIRGQRMEEECPGRSHRKCKGPEVRGRCGVLGTETVSPDRGPCGGSPETRREEETANLQNKLLYMKTIPRS